MFHNSGRLFKFLVAKTRPAVIGDVQFVQCQKRSPPVGRQIPEPANFGTSPCSPALWSAAFSASFGRFGRPSPRRGAGSKPCGGPAALHQPRIQGQQRVKRTPRLGVGCGWLKSKSQRVLVFTFGNRNLPGFLKGLSLGYTSDHTETWGNKACNLLDRSLTYFSL